MTSSQNIVNLLIQGFEQRDLCIFNIGAGTDNAMVFICNLYRTFVKFPGLPYKSYTECDDSKSLIFHNYSREDYREFKFRNFCDRK